MFKKSRSKTNQQEGSRESVENSGSHTGTINDNLAVTKDAKESMDKILHQKVHFQVSFLGVVRDMNMTNSRKRDTEAHLIDQVEEAQIDGKLPIAPRKEDTFILNVSRHGIKLLDNDGQEVLQRHPLHTIAQVIRYGDGFGKQNIAVKIGQVGKNVFQCFVYQCHSEDQAQAICQCIGRIFDAITVKA